MRGATASTTMQTVKPWASWMDKGSGSMVVKMSNKSTGAVRAGGTELLQCNIDPSQH